MDATTFSDTILTAFKSRLERELRFESEKIVARVATETMAGISVIARQEPYGRIVFEISFNQKPKERPL